MRIKNILKVLLVSCLFFVAGSLFPVKAQTTPHLFFDPASATVAVGTDFQVNVKIDTGSTQIFGADAVINYPSDGFSVKSVTYGNFFPENFSSQSSGQITLRGDFSPTPTSLGSGSGIFATITFNASKAAGTGAITFGCPGTDIIDSSGAYIITSCASQSLITFTTGSVSTPTPVPGTSPSPGATVSPTNACGGTCGSAYNCNVNLFCYQGYCRNPDCPSSNTCGCSVATPTPRPTARPTFRPTPIPTASATPVVVVLSQTTPFPLPPEVAALATPAEATSQGSVLKPIYVAWAIGIILLIIIIIVLINTFRRRPPKMVTPGGSSPDTFPVKPPLNSPPWPSNPV